MRTNKQVLFATAVLMTAVMGGEHTAVAASDNTTVKITGTVRANTCTVKNEAGGSLGEVSVRDFKEAGTVVGLADVPVEFTDCGGQTSGVTVKVTGVAAGSGGAFRNDNEANSVEGTAKNVGVYFYDADEGHTQIKAGTDITAKEQKFDHDTILHYKASFVSITDSVGAGSLLTTITMSFTYT